MEDQSTHAEGTPAESQETTGVRLPEVANLIEMMRVMIQDRERRKKEVTEERRRREREFAEERKRRQDETERQMTEMYQQMERLQQMLTEQSNATVASRGLINTGTVKLTKLTEEDDIESYLTTFERIMSASEVDRERWSFYLAPYLTGKAQQAYAALSPDDAKAYDAIKEAVLRRYDINEETYRQRFRKLRSQEGESPLEVITRLRDLATRWARESKSRDDLLDLMVMEQFLAILPDDIRVSVLERQPKDCDEAGRFAGSYLQARSRTITWRDRKLTAPVNKCPRCEKHGHWARNCPKHRDVDGRDSERQPSSLHQTTTPKNSRPQGRNMAEVRCYNCNEKGHFSSSCPRRLLYCGRAKVQTKGEERVHRRGIVNGVYCTKILVDTGATQTLVRKDLISNDDILDGEVMIRCAHGDTVSYPLAVVKINIGGKDIITTAAVSSTLPASVLLGWDIPELTSFITDGQNDQRKADALAVMMRLRRVQQRKAPERELPNTTVQASPRPVEHNTTEEADSKYLFHLDDCLFTPPAAEKPKLTRAQKRANCHHFRSQNQSKETGSDESGMLDLMHEELRELQVNDASLDRAREIADGAPSAAAGEQFFYHDGVLYRHYRRRCSDGSDTDDADVDQLVLPTELRPTVLKLAHSIPMAGHLGRKKTTDRIIQRFYWPGIFRDVQDYCRTCTQCQKLLMRGFKKALLVPLPIMDEPFKRIAMDIVGPLPRSSSGKRYILVICDYATRYPEAVAMRTIDANAVAEELLAFFSRVGVPEEILTDQGTNFTSQLLAEVYRLLQIKPIRMTPYHPQTDGLVERFNGTLKAMLKKTAIDEGKEWDRLLPYLLFAYREVPQASTGFSPFELLYGRNVRGPLDILKETWEAKRKSPKSVVSYVLMMQERLSKLSTLVHDNLRKAQEKQKEWYDCHAGERKFQAGDQVLILLPTSTNKLLAEWCGPYTVTRKISDVNYEVQLTEGRHKK